MTLRKLAIFFKVSVPCVENDVVHCLHQLVEPLIRRYLPAVNAGHVELVAISVAFLNAFGVVDAFSILIQRSLSNHNDYHFGNSKNKLLKSDRC
jgi:hypothetical protein